MLEEYLYYKEHYFYLLNISVYIGLSKKGKNKMLCYSQYSQSYLPLLFFFLKKSD